MGTAFAVLTWRISSALHPQARTQN